MSFFVTLAGERELRELTNRQRLLIAQPVKLPYSEVCVHMQVAGETRPVIALMSGMAQILNPDGSLFSFPVCRGEAGLRYTNARVHGPGCLGDTAADTAEQHNVSASNCRAATQDDRIVSMQHCEQCE